MFFTHKCLLDKDVQWPSIMLLGRNWRSYQNYMKNPCPKHIFSPLGIIWIKLHSQSAYDQGLCSDFEIISYLLVWFNIDAFDWSKKKLDTCINKMFAWYTFSQLFLFNTIYYRTRISKINTVNKMYSYYSLIVRKQNLTI